MTCDLKKKDITLRLLRKGWTTALQSALAGGVLALSQRVGEWERGGMSIDRRWTATEGGARVLAYRALPKPKKATQFIGPFF